jgi:hypothetical protein
MLFLICIIIMENNFSLFLVTCISYIKLLKDNNCETFEGKLHFVKIRVEIDLSINGVLIHVF